MALTAGTVCEIRTTGSQNAGGGFYDRNPGTSVDYSQQDSPQLTLTDLATDGAGTGLSSATGGFTAAMAGNLIQITGGTLTAGWYEITAYTDTNNVTIDRSDGLSKSGGNGIRWGRVLDWRLDRWRAMWRRPPSRRPPPRGPSPCRAGSRRQRAFWPPGLSSGLCRAESMRRRR